MNSIVKPCVSRISVSLQEHLLTQFDQMVAQRGFESRSQAIAEMIVQQIAEHKQKLGEDIMTGTITLMYDHTVPGLQKHLTDLQHQYVDEVISSLHVHLMHPHTMEVILVQGPATRLQSITDKMVTCRGVVTGKLQLTPAIIPPLHPLPAQESGNTTQQYSAEYDEHAPVEL